MFVSKKRLSQMSNATDELHMLSEEDLSKLHACLLECLKDIMEVCDKYSIKPMVGGGSAIGLVRHNGFIPWDDDLDMMISRKDYNKLLKIFNKELGDRYYLLAPGRKQGANCYLARIMRKGTTYVNMLSAGAKYPNCIYIDLTPIDYVPNNKIMRKCKGFISNVLKFASYSVFWYKNQNPYLANYMNSNEESKKYYKNRLFVGMCFSFLSAEKWFAIFDKFVQGKETKYMTIASGRMHYSGEMLHKDVFFPVKEGKFEGIKVYIPNDIDKYLSNLYGDYMEIPPEDKREKHLCVAFDCNHEQ
ncbi:LicD family protein [Anaerosacchariphilus polymeriproducens]|uniref:LicD family protein n=1 Tax=Anaerosacchariphilus polymeriproducens TaxID=1812858 RepID=A0A371ARB4_9FIRM|nr:LicD family protein [Anaerosacchariphilus polymeriproducens]RDU22113.1 LicD family protein [Anaerosacchariphilus polymeriproducens]